MLPMVCGELCLLGGALCVAGKVTKSVTTSWTNLGITAKGLNVTVSIDGRPQASVLLPPPVELLEMGADGTSMVERIGAGTGAGMVAISSGYNVAYFDNFAVEAA